MQHIGKILPVDGYYVELKESLPTNYLASLVHLYQPLIGLDAIGLYQTLLLERDLQVHGDLQTHHTLMSQLNMPLDKIYQTRTRLEGIGLLKTFKNETEHNVSYVYRLLNPLRPSAFFQDMMLSELLYRQIGESKYRRLKQFYSEELTDPTGNEVTVSFEEVFQTFKPSGNVTQIAFDQPEPAHVPLKEVDFTIIQQGLINQMVAPEKVLTTQNKRVITQLMQLYDLETYEIEKSILWALTDENDLDVEQLKAASHDLFQAKHNVANVQLSEKTLEIPQAKVLPTVGTTREERLIARLEVISPKQLLEDLSSGNNASSEDMKIVTEVMIEQGLPTAVMNVLVYYVLLKSEMKLTKPYLSKIGSNWSRLGFKTAKEAFLFAKNVNKPKAPKQKQSYQRQYTGPQEIIPDWFKGPGSAQEEVAATRVEESKLKVVSPASASQNDEEAEMMAILKKYTNKE